MRKVAAIALNTIKQIFSMKAAIVFMLLLLVLLPLMGLTMTGDGTLKGRLQTFVSYSLSLVSLLLCLLTIILAVYSLTSDIKQRQIFTLATKPVKRFQIILGKFLGVVAVDTILLILFAAIIYFSAVSIPRFVDAPGRQVRAAGNEFFTARASVEPVEKDVSVEVEETYEKLKNNPDFLERFENDSEEDIKKALRNRKILEQRSVAAGERIVWEFRDIEPIDPGQSLFIKFKYDVSVTPPDQSVYSRWIIGDTRPENYKRNMDSEVYMVDRKDTIRKFFEIEVPADAIAEDGYLGVTFINVPNLNNTTVIFPPKDGLSLLYKAGNFTSNFIRATSLIFGRLVFLAVLGLLTATFLSFPVAVMLCLSIFSSAMISSFVLDSFQFLNKTAGTFYNYTVEPLMKLLPRFDQFNPSDYIVPGRVVPWSAVIELFLVMICFKSTLLLVFGLLIFRRKELAKITV